MKSTILSLILFLVLSCCIAGEAPDRSDEARLQGVWLAQSESKSGREWKVSYQYAFEGDEVRFTDETGKETRYAFTLDTHSNPKLIVIRPLDAPGDPTPVNVAYELDGDSLKIVVAPAGSQPREISDKNDQELIVCKRKGR